MNSTPKIEFLPLKIFIFIFIFDPLITNFGSALMITARGMQLCRT
jgi:hypothetical protein